MTDCTQCGGTELVEDALGKTIRCPECTWQPDPVAADGRTIEALQAEVARLRAALSGKMTFDGADWYWRTMDPDDCGDSPEEALNRGMVGLFCVCEVASSYSGPIRYGFIAPVLDQDSDDEEFVHFATQQEAMDAAKARAALKGGA